MIKREMLRCLIITIVLVTIGCSEDDEMSCRENATLESEGRGFECVRGVGKLFTRGDNENLSISFNNTDFAILVFSDSALEAKTYEGISEASFVFNGIQNLNSVRITITELDREAEFASGNFEAKAEGTTSTISMTGTFERVPF